ncbi:MAG TPA: pyridoxamine 5'-phosphate oxidase family protein [Terriglobales bacterium]|nr:pyridoxamine 5'-phosphate oxidase family protein [Terriglobales bacterium]
MASLTDALVQQLLNGRYIGSLATQNQEGSIHMVAVWYWFDGSNIFVATASRSRKARNMKSSSKATLMIDSRDPQASFGATIIGTVKILQGSASQKLNAEIHRKYLSSAAIADPRVGPVFAGWDDVTVQITPVSVISWDMREADAQVFGGSFKNNPTYLLPLEP